MTSPTNRKSYVLKLYGDPADYAYKLANDTFSDQLPILMNWYQFEGYDFFHSMSIDYYQQRIYFGNNLHRRLEFGHFIYNNESHTWYFDFVPESNEVITELTSSLYARRNDLHAICHPFAQLLSVFETNISYS